MAAELKRKIEQLKKSEQEAHQANNAKDDFLASMSHELRTPLASIIGNSEILIEDSLTTDQQSLVDSVKHSSQNLLSLVNDILDLSKIEAGKLEIDYAPFDLIVLLNELERMFSVAASDAQVTYVVKKNIAQEFQLWGDGKRIGQIMINLIGNAIKFTEQGNVTVTCWKENRLLCLSVDDSGIGMPPEVLDRLFKPFEQADQSISRRYGGTGLGLNISWKLATMMKGTIEVSSQEGIGSSFVLKLPYKESELSIKPLELGGERGNASVLDKRFEGDVLVVEDTPELQLLEQRILRSMGATVTTADDGQQAVTLVKKQRFDLILMDMQMPVMDGLEATRCIRANDNQTPIVALTANVMQKHRDEFHEAGADGFLHKPIDREELRRVLDQFLNSDQKPELKQSQNQKLPTDTETHATEMAISADISSPYPVLVIDDEQKILDLYQFIFEGEDENVLEQFLAVVGDKKVKPEREFAVTQAIQGELGIEEAQNALAQGRPYLVAFIDIRIPNGMNGIETAKALRQLDPRITIVIVTAYSDFTEEEIIQELEYGVLFMNKPFSHEETIEIARREIERWKHEYLPIEITEKVLDKVVTPEQSYSIEPEAEAEKEVDDELMEIFRESATNNRKLLIDALGNQDWSAVKDVAHPVKGSGSSFGFPILTEKAKEVCDAYDNGQMEQISALTEILIAELDKALS